MLQQESSNEGEAPGMQHNAICVAAGKGLLVEESLTGFLPLLQAAKRAVARSKPHASAADSWAASQSNQQTS